MFELDNNNRSLNSSFIFHLSYSYFSSIRRQVSLCTVFSGRSTAIQRQIFQLSADCYRIVGLLPTRLCEVLLQLLRNSGVDIPLTLHSGDPTMIQGSFASESVLHVNAHEAPDEVFGLLADVIPVG